MKASRAYCASCKTLSEDERPQHVCGSFHTFFTDLEEFIGLPSNNASWKTAPAPFDYAGQDLKRINVSTWAGPKNGLPLVQ